MLITNKTASSSLFNLDLFCPSTTLTLPIACEELALHEITKFWTSPHCKH